MQVQSEFEASDKMSFMRRLCSKKWVFILLVVSCPLLIFFGEYGIYRMNTLWWTDLNCEHPNCSKILVVSKPRLLGNEYSPQFTFEVARKDNDWYLQRTYALAYDHFKPDIVLFLGQLLNEGSYCFQPILYDKYCKRFDNVFGSGWRQSTNFYMNDLSNGPVPVKKTEIMANKCFPPTNTSMFLNGNTFEIIPYNGLNRHETKSNVTKYNDHCLVISSTNIGYYNFESTKYLKDCKTLFTLSPGYDRAEQNFINRESGRNGMIRGNQFSSGEVITHKYNNLDIENGPSEYDELLVEILVPSCNYEWSFQDIGYMLIVIDNDSVRLEFLGSHRRQNILIAYLVWFCLGCLWVVMVFVLPRIYRRIRNYIPHTKGTLFSDLFSHYKPLKSENDK